MPDFQQWRFTSEQLDAMDRAIDAWRRISEKPVSIVIVRGAAVTLSAQTVRIEYDSSVNRELEGGAGRSSARALTLFGIHDHPQYPNTNLAREDRFKHNGVLYRVIDVITLPGELQARAEVVS